MSGGEGPPGWAAMIPGLPGDVAAHILTLIPYSHHARLRPTCRSWRAFLSPPPLIPRRRRSLPPTSLSHLLCIFPSDPSLPLRPLPPALRLVPPPRLPLPPLPLRPLQFRRPLPRPPPRRPRRRPLLPHRPPPSLPRRLLPPPLLPRPRLAPSLPHAPPPRRLRLRSRLRRRSHHRRRRGLPAPPFQRRRRVGAGGRRDVRRGEGPVGRSGGDTGGEGGVRRVHGGERGVLGRGRVRGLSHHFGVFPVDEYYRDGVIFDLEGGGWR